MAGKPKTRAKEAAAAAAIRNAVSPAPTIPDAVVTSPDAVRNARAHARAREAGNPSPVRHPGMGPASRNAVDEQQATTVRTLGAQLRPGMRVRIERVRPQWASGWLEDFVLARGEGFGSLLEHVQGEYGGHSYLLQVLAAGDVVLFEGGLQVAGPPLEHGVPINRARWEGRDDDDAPRRNAAMHQPATPAPAFNLEGVVSLASLVLGAFQKHQSEQMGAVREMVTQSRELVVAALGQREQQANKSSFASQLGEIVEATRGIEKVKRQLFGSAAQRTPDDAEPEDETKMLVREAGKQFPRT